MHSHSQAKPDSDPVPPRTPAPRTCAAERLGGRPPPGPQRRASGRPVLPDVCRSVPGPPPGARLKTDLRSQLCLPPVKQSGLWASLAEEVGYIWGVCFTATGCLFGPGVGARLTVSKPAKLSHVSEQSGNTRGNRMTKKKKKKKKIQDMPNSSAITEYIIVRFSDM